jgi:hypothetical protein
LSDQENDLIALSSKGKTTIWSAARMVEWRCAATNTVHSVDICSIAPTSAVSLTVFQLCGISLDCLSFVEGLRGDSLEDGVA